jgi:hypothetical protein
VPQVRVRSLDANLGQHIPTALIDRVQPLAPRARDGSVFRILPARKSKTPHFIVVVQLYI